MNEMEGIGARAAMKNEYADELLMVNWMICIMTEGIGMFLLIACNCRSEIQPNAENEKLALQAKVESLEIDKKYVKEEGLIIQVW